MMHPDFAMGYYFLGYAYLNMGLYLKAQLTWKDFLRLSSGSGTDSDITDDDMMASLRDEISQRVEELSDPVEIERGCNMIMSGDYQGGKAVLDDHREGRFAAWWPLWYYLGTAESALGHSSEAAECYKRVLQISPSNTDAMEELAAIYAMSGDEENASKYRKKIEIVRSGLYDHDAGGS
jgi:tetratricopeptide (TPR) repeat protein